MQHNESNALKYPVIVVFDIDLKRRKDRRYGRFFIVK